MKYLAKTDDGHDFGEIVYTSDHRAGSRANWEDARAALWRKKGAYIARRAIITEVARCDDEGIQAAPFTDVRKYEYE